MRSLRILTATAAVLAVVLAAAPAAEARTKRLLPATFVSVTTGVDSVLMPMGMGALTVGAAFMRDLKLPVGATLTGIRLYSTGGADTRYVEIYKSQSGVLPILMAVATETAATLDPTTPMETPGVVNPTPPYNVVEPGYLYQVLVSCSPFTAVWAVDVDYTP